jgi:hypothetical protein
MLSFVYLCALRGSRLEYQNRSTTKGTKETERSCRKTYCSTKNWAILRNLS